MDQECLNGACAPMDRHTSQPLEIIVVEAKEYDRDEETIRFVLERYPHFKEILDEKDRKIAQLTAALKALVGSGRIEG